MRAALAYSWSIAEESSFQRFTDSQIHKFTNSQANEFEASSEHARIRSDTIE
jgi:hypothetical protein